MCSSKFFRKLLAAFILAAGLALTSTSLALAHSGPVSDPPGGVTLTEAGDCTGAPNYDVIGECQGRTGGLNLTYSGFDFTQFQELYWGPAFFGDIRLRFGGHDWFGYLNYRAADSNLENGVAVWRGNTDIPISNGSGYSYTYVDTRFTLVVTDLDGNPLRIEEPGSIEGLMASGPMLHITSDFSNFKANILFEFYYGGTWHKALEGYDSLPTPPTPGQVLSWFQPSFFYTDVPLDGLSATNDSPTPFGSTTILTATVLTGTNPVYTWDYGDGALGSGAVTGHIYAGTGLFTAVVTATNEANVITATTFVTITETPITGLSASNNSPTRLGDVTTLQASVTGGSNITYAWALGDGTLATGQIVAHTYPSAGYYTAWVTATNVFNQLTATTTVTVPFEVLLTDPAANHPAAAPTAPLTVTFSGDVAPSTISTATLAVSGAFTGLHGGSFGFTDPRQVVFTPSTEFLPGELVTVQVLTGVQSTAGLPLNAPYQWQFYTAAPTGSGYFINSSQVLTAAHSLGGSLGDLDGDGDLDVLQANYAEDNVVWINDGTGFFTAIVQDLGSEFNVDTALGDLDGDGDLDAFFAKLGTPDEVWLNDGSGTFTNSGQTLGATSSVDIILGDLDHDGDLDAYAATYNGASDQVWLNDGSGLFTNSGQDLGDRPSMAAALGDLDGDSDLDAYVLYLNQPNKIWLNDGQGQFSDSGQDLGSLPAQEVDLGDLDGDGDLDAFIAIYDQPCQVWLNNGQGLFSNSGQALGNFTSMSLDLGDVDADGDLDAFVANLGQPDMVWLNDGQGLFTSRGQNLGSSSSRQAMLGDLDGDGDLDAFVAASAEPSQVWFNQVAVENTTPPPGSHAATAGTNLDVRLSGPISSTTVTTHTFQVHGAFQGPLGGSFTNTLTSNPPVVAFDPQEPLLPGERVQATFSNRVLDENGAPLYPYVWEFRAAVAGGSGSFTNSGQGLSSPSGWRVDLGDLDDDGDLDVVLVNYLSNPSQVWLNNGSGVYTLHQSLATNQATDVALGDLDEDGDLDAFITQMELPLLVWFNDGSGNFTISGQSLGTFASYAVSLGDLDGDGDLDTFVATYNEQPDRVLFNDGSGIFSDSGQSLGAEYAVGMTLGDVDNDGDLDAYVANCHTTATDKLWLNDGRGQFSDSGQTIDGLCSNDADLGDVDSDGDLDVVVANAAAGGQPNQLFFNDGDGTLSNSGQNLGSYQTLGIEFGDLDADGDLDLFYTTIDAGQHVWRNDGSGTFTDTLQVLGNASSRGLALGDLDSDGDLDAFVPADGEISGQPSEIWFNENSADLALGKSVSPALPQPGGWITYTLAFTNLGPQTATGVQIVDQLPVSITISSLSVSSSLPITSTGGPSFTWLLPDLAPSDGGRITITGQLSATLPSGQTFTNTASLSALEWDPVLSNNQSQASLTTNQAPLAAAGADQNVDRGVLVTLDGQGSLDPDGDLPLTYQWTQTNGAAVTLSDQKAVTPTFTAPANPAVLTFSLVVTDSLGTASAPDAVSVTVGNQTPVANAGTDQSVLTLAAVTLDGSGSDPDGDLPLAYQWTQTGGPAVTLSDPAAANPDFTAPANPAVLTFSLVVTDNLGAASAPDAVTITVGNQAPAANAGVDQNVSTLAAVTLDGSGSDPDGDLPLAYQWTQTGGPSVTLSNPAAAKPGFTAPANPAVLTFSLVVTDNLGAASAPDTVTITVGNQAPVADAGNDQNVLTLAAVTLDGSGSDPDGDLPLAYQWTQTGGPSVTLSNPAAAKPGFTAPANPAVLTFSLVVTDNLGAASAPDTVTITVGNQAPAANAGADQNVLTLAAVTLDGSGSDPDGDLPLTYQWTQTGGPSVTLSNPAAAKPGFTAPANPAVLTFSLVVTDSLGAASAPDAVSVTVGNQTPVANAGTDQSVLTLAAVTLDGSGSDPDGDLPLAYQWTQTGGPAVTLSDPAAAKPGFTAPGNPAVLTFSLVVTDSLGAASAPDAVSITVGNQAPAANAGADQNVLTMTPVMLDGSGSDPDGDLPLAYQWTQTGGPAVTLSDPNTAKPSFRAPAIPAILTFRLTVTDNLGLVSVPDEIIVIVQGSGIFLPIILR